MAHASSLSRAEVEHLFSRLAVRYGALWLRHWEGLDMELVMADWAIQLGGLSAPAISHAIVNLPLSRIPLVGEFRALAVGAPDIALPALPWRPTAADRAAKSRIAQRLHGIGSQRKDPRDWARRLQAREAGGEVLTAAQKTAWRAALSTEPAMDAE